MSEIFSATPAICIDFNLKSRNPRLRKPDFKAQMRVKLQTHSMYLIGVFYLTLPTSKMPTFF